MMHHHRSTLSTFVACLLLSACCSAPPKAAEPPPAEPAPVVPEPAEPPPPVMCGGIAAIACAPDQFCDVAGHCGAGDQSGTCAPVPNMCTRDFRPVCGCDGKTYPNACTAHAARVSVAADGECKPP